MGRRIGAHQSNINAIVKERTGGNLSTEMMVAICKSFREIDGTWLLTGEGEMLRGHILKEKYVDPDEAVRVLGESGEVYETWAAGVERRLRELEEEVKRLKGLK